MKYLISFIVSFALIGCSTNHFSEAILYKHSSGNIFNIPSTGNNPIYVDSNSVFKIEIEDIKPGWIHNGVTMPKLDENQYKSFSRKITSHLYGKELWLLTKIESLSSDDVLERNSKTYYKTTNIKFNSESFSKIALDQSEKAIFAHSADSQYRITFKVYEVDGFNIKKAAVKAYDDSPGLAGILSTISKTITSTLGSLAGSILTDLWKNASEEQLFVERLLLENSATLEFQGSLYVVRNDEILTNHMPIVETRYILYDKFKSEGWDTNYTNKVSYIARKQEKDQSVDISPPTGNAVDTKTYIKIKITQALPDQSSKAKDKKSFINNDQIRENFLNTIEVD